MSPPPPFSLPPPTRLRVNDRPSPLRYLRSLAPAVVVCRRRAITPPGRCLRRGIHAASPLSTSTFTSSSSASHHRCCCVPAVTKVPPVDASEQGTICWGVLGTVVGYFCVERSFTRGACVSSGCASCARAGEARDSATKNCPGKTSGGAISYLRVVCRCSGPPLPLPCWLATAISCTAI
jgi:hypothetical protein